MVAIAGAIDHLNRLWFLEWLIAFVERTKFKISFAFFISWIVWWKIDIPSPDNPPITLNVEMDFQVRSGLLTLLHFINDPDKIGPITRFYSYLLLYWSSASAFVSWHLTLLLPSSSLMINTELRNMQSCYRKRKDGWCQLSKELRRNDTTSDLLKRLSLYLIRLVIPKLLTAILSERGHKSLEYSF